ncbi:MAG: hypothetical protein AAB336_05435 [Acidobacteriota bacterium]
MGHNITAIILSGDFDRDLAKEFGLIEKNLSFELTLFHIDGWYAAYWQHLLKTEGELGVKNICKDWFMIIPSEIALAEIMKRISKQSEPKFAIVITDYFGGIGFQWANVFRGSINADKQIETINQALRYLDVNAKAGLDEFDTVGLDKIRSQPGYLEKYRDLYDELGLD